MNFRKIIRPILAVMVLTLLIYIKFQEGNETTLFDYTIDVAIVIILLAYAEEILLLLVSSPCLILEKLKKFMRYSPALKLKK